MALQWTAWATLAALMVYAWMLMKVGQARGKFKINAPATDGPVEFQSVLRVQANTVEQMVVFFPALWMCAYFEGDKVAAIGGFVWSIGRIVYALGYYKEPAKRSLGFTITSLASLALMIGTAVGLITK
ncbi:MAG: MAPEG family protein [Burkholderiaceae bacterium]|nr:MAPEG family protein [Burkholderiaceae bacterium]